MGHILACPRRPAASLKRSHPTIEMYCEMLESNQQLASCCRDTDGHEIEAWFSSEADAAKGIPDIYINHCTCGRLHRRFCVGSGLRPFWEVR